MFDNELRVNGLVDLDMATVWAAACNRAADLMRRARELREACLDCTVNVSGHVWCSRRLEATALRTAAKSTMYPFRVAIKERTERESLQARGMVTVRMSRWFDGRTAFKPCTDCERPMWQHIELIRDRILCPFGREYWTYARALAARTREDIEFDGFENLAPIARTSGINSQAITLE